MGLALAQELRTEVLKKIEKAKSGGLRFSFTTKDGKSAELKAFTREIFDDPKGIELLMTWRNAASRAFPAQFVATMDGTRAWVEKAVINTPDRILFWVIDSLGHRVGHVGLFRLSSNAQHIEIDSIVRGEAPANSGLMASAIPVMLKWQRDELGVPESYLRVFDDSLRAIQLYERLGYREIQRVPLKSVKTGERTEWHEIVNDAYVKAERYFITMHQVNRS